jgi:transposase-like protein
MNCPACQHENGGRILGRLGRLTHFRCIFCGCTWAEMFGAQDDHEEGDDE